MNRTFALFGAVYGLLGVGLGAWGAHGLTTYLGHNNLSAWDTAVLYQLVHAPVLLIVGLWSHSQPRFAISFAGWCIALGILLFSGSLYGLTLGGPRVLGPVTPLGGSILILGWATLLWCAFRPAHDR